MPCSPSSLMFPIGYRSCRAAAVTRPSLGDLEEIDLVLGRASSTLVSPANRSRRCYTDPMSTDELLAEALRLTRADRARVAEELLSSLEEPDDEVAAAWATELERRSREVAEGRAQPTSWPTARTEILKELEQRRASRTAS